MTQKYDLHYQSCTIHNGLRNNQFSRFEIRNLVFAIYIADIGLISKQINTETRLSDSRSFKAIQDRSRSDFAY